MNSSLEKTFLEIRDKERMIKSNFDCVSGITTKVYFPKSRI